jgi:hypothetical protein
MKIERERHDSFKERVKSLDHDHHESGQGEGPPVVLEPRADEKSLAAAVVRFLTLVVRKNGRRDVAHASKCNLLTNI